MKFLFVVFILSSFSVTINAQDFEKFSLEPDFHIKFSLGEQTRKTINYQPGITFNVPEQENYLSPVYGIGFKLNYSLNQKFSMGVGSGIDIVKFDMHPIISDEYYDRIMLPLLLKVRYQSALTGNWLLLSEVSTGYQFFDFRYGNTQEGFLYQESGGFIFGFDVGIGKKVGKYLPIFKVGYEFNQFASEFSLGTFPGFDLDYQDKVFYKSRYHLIETSLSIKI